MTIEQNKFYRTRGGDKVEVIKTGCQGGKIIWYKESNNHVGTLESDGMFFIYGALSNDDLIEEWTDPVEIPWDDYPAWAKWIAMDQDGRWFGWEKYPSSTVFVQHWGNGGHVTFIPQDYTPKNFTGDWTESLFARP